MGLEDLCHCRAGVEFLVSAVWAQPPGHIFINAIDILPVVCEGQGELQGSQEQDEGIL